MLYMWPGMWPLLAGRADRAARHGVTTMLVLTAVAAAGLGAYKVVNGGTVRVNGPWVQQLWGCSPKTVGVIVAARMASQSASISVGAVDGAHTSRQLIFGSRGHSIVAHTHACL